MKRQLVVFFGLFLLGQGIALAGELDVEMVFVEGGCLQVAESSAGEGGGDSGRDVCVDSFYISKDEITQRQWQMVKDAPPSRFGDYRRAFEEVDWGKIDDFVAKLSEQTGRAYRLPRPEELQYFVGSGKSDPDSLGFYENSGEVWEWCRERYDADYFEVNPKLKPRGYEPSRYLAEGDGGFRQNLGRIPRAYRYSCDKADKVYTLGFRLVHADNP